MNDATVRLLVAGALLAGLGLLFGAASSDPPGGAVLTVCLGGVLFLIGLIGYVAGSRSD